MRLIPKHAILYLEADSKGVPSMTLVSGEKLMLSKKPLREGYGNSELRSIYEGIERYGFYSYYGPSDYPL